MPDYHADLPDAGNISHAIIDANLPTDDEKEGLRQLAPTIPDFGDNSLLLKVYTDDVSDPPTDAELDAAIGTPATVGAGFIAIMDDNGAGAALYIVASDGTNWWHAALTKAV
jgi:hypothetical protein